MEVPFNEVDINPLCGVFLHGYNWRCGLNYTYIEVQTLQGTDMFLLLEINARRGPRSVMGARCVISDDDIKIIYDDANNL